MKINKATQLLDNGKTFIVRFRHFVLLLLFSNFRPKFFIFRKLLRNIRAEKIAFLKNNFRKNTFLTELPPLLLVIAEDKIKANFGAQKRKVFFGNHQTIYRNFSFIARILYIHI